eukprot:gene6109-7612_t
MISFNSSSAFIACIKADIPSPSNTKKKQTQQQQQQQEQVSTQTQQQQKQVREELIHLIDNSNKRGDVDDEDEEDDNGDKASMYEQFTIKIPFDQLMTTIQQNAEIAELIQQGGVEIQQDNQEQLQQGQANILQQHLDDNIPKSPQQQITQSIPIQIEFIDKSLSPNALQFKIPHKLLLLNQDVDYAAIESPNSFLFSQIPPSKSIFYGNSPNNNKNTKLPGNDLYIQGQLKRGYVLETKKNPDGSQTESFEYIGGDIDMIRSIQLLTESANLGNHKAMFLLGNIEEMGETGVINFTKAAEWYLKSSEYGNSDAQNAMGFLYSTGKGVPIDEGKAILYYTFAAKSGNVMAQLSLAYRYIYGYGVKKSCLKSVRLYEEVARQVVNDHESRGFGYEIHSERFDEDFQKSTSEEEDIVDFFKYSASIGDAKALVTMAKLYLQGGLGVAQDFRTALEYFREAANQEFPSGLAGLGFMYSKGYGVKQDNQTAVVYFQRASNLGHVGAKSNLAEMYLNGYGVQQNQRLAHLLFSEAAKKDDVDAQVNLGKMYLNGIYVNRDPNEAFKYFSSAAQKGNPTAFYNLAKINLLNNSPATCMSSLLFFKKVAEKGPWSLILTQAHELFKEGDEERSLLFFEKAAEMGIEVAQNNAGWMYDLRIGVSDSQDEEFLDRQAFRYFSHSAEQNSGFAHLKLGDYFYYGKGAEKNIEKAAEEYQIAAKMENSQALFNLGYMHQFGKGKTQDLFLAKRYYDAALQKQANAYIPVYLALSSLLFHFIYYYVYSLFNPSIKFGSSSGSNSDSILPPSSQSDELSSKYNSGGEDHFNIGSNENPFIVDDEDSYSYSQSLESFSIFIIALIIGYLVIRRQRAILRQPQQPQQQHQPQQPPLPN